MKKFIALLLCGILTATALTGCGSSSAGGENGEVIALQDMGHKRLALEAGEDPVNNPIEYILESIKTVYSIKHKNGSISVSFSPMPENLMGLPVTLRTLSAAPPLVSPSSFVSITPVMPSFSLKELATLTAS